MGLHAPQRAWLTSGTVSATVLCVPVALVFSLQAVQAAQQHRWDAVAGFAWATLCFMGVPALGAKAARWFRGRLGHLLRGRKPPEPPPSFI
jgi:hypothetical protein